MYTKWFTGFVICNWEKIDKYATAMSCELNGKSYVCAMKNSDRKFIRST